MDSMTTSLVWHVSGLGCHNLRRLCAGRIVQMSPEQKIHDACGKRSRPMRGGESRYGCIIERRPACHPELEAARRSTRTRSWCYDIALRSCRMRENVMMK